MDICRCAPPALLHILPTGVHLPDGRRSDLLLVDEPWSDSDPRCSVCAATIESTFFRCGLCQAIVCRTCVAHDTAVVECDCLAEVAVTGVQRAAIRASAQLAP
jgi:hypothetical protein